MLFGLDFGEFGVWTQSAVSLSRPKAFLQDTLYDTCTHFQLPGTHGVRSGDSGRWLVIHKIFVLCLIGENESANRIIEICFEKIVVDLFNESIVETYKLRDARRLTLISTPARRGETRKESLLVGDGCAHCLAVWLRRPNAAANVF